MGRLPCSLVVLCPAKASNPFATQISFVYKVVTAQLSCEWHEQRKLEINKMSTSLMLDFIFIMAGLYLFPSVVEKEYIKCTDIVNKKITPIFLYRLYLQ